MGIIVFNGKSTVDFPFPVQVEHPPGYTGAERDYDAYHVPGRNGDLHIDKGTYKNVPIPYDISFGSPFKVFDEMAGAVAEWLYSSNDYSRLEDSYSPEYFRLAKYSGPTEFENILNHGGRGTITFDCKPQKFLKLGEKPVIFTKAGSLRNPTIFESTPIIVVKGTGSGSLNIGGYLVSISNIGSSITLDSDLQDAYNGTENKNGVISLNTRNTFPKLGKGENEISFSGGITSVEVTPRWWTVV